MVTITAERSRTNKEIAEWAEAWIRYEYVHCVGHFVVPTRFRSYGVSIANVLYSWLGGGK
jgi:hypothetical protein